MCFSWRNGTNQRKFAELHTSMCRRVRILLQAEQQHVALNVSSYRILFCLLSALHFLSSFSTAVCLNPRLSAGMQAHVRLLSSFIVNVYGLIINQHPSLQFRWSFRLPVKSLSLSSSFFLVLSELLNHSLLFHSFLLSLHLPAWCQGLLFVVPCLQMARSDHLLMMVAHSKAVTAASAWQPSSPHLLTAPTHTQAGEHTFSQWLERTQWLQLTQPPSHIHVQARNILVLIVMRRLTHTHTHTFACPHSAPVSCYVALYFCASLFLPPALSPSSPAVVLLTLSHTNKQERRG